MTAGDHQVTDARSLPRRRFLLATAATLASTTAGCGTGSGDGGGGTRVPAGPGGRGDGGHHGGSRDRVRDAGTSWMRNVDNYHGYADHRGQSRVEVRVGAPANGGHHGFDPAGLEISAGTTVVWTWTGDGGDHAVVERGGAFESTLTDEAGHTFERTFSESAVVRYYCPTHRSVGMRGAVLVR